VHFRIPKIYMSVHLLFRLGKSLSMDCRFCSNICVILRLCEKLVILFFLILEKQKHTQCFKAFKNYRKQLQSFLPSKATCSNTMLEIVSKSIRKCHKKKQEIWKKKFKGSSQVATTNKMNKFYDCFFYFFNLQGHMIC
jgi:hypothetical protein